MRLQGTVLAVLLAAALLGPAPAGATGYAIYEQGAGALGMAGAQVASVHDASALFFNPAAMTRLEGTRVYAGGSVLQPMTSFAGTGPNPGWGYTDEMVRQSFYPPTVYATHALGKAWAIGAGLNSPYGLGVEWNPASFAGRDLVTKVELQSLNATGCLAWAPNRWLSVAGGADVLWAKVKLANRTKTVLPGGGGATMDVAAVNLNSGFTPAPGWNAAVLVTPDPKWSVGAYYRSKIVVKVDDATADFVQLPTGDATLDALVAAELPANQGVSTVLHFPAIWAAGVSYRPAPAWTTEADFVLYEWKVFRDLPIRFHDDPSLDLVRVEDYSNSWQVRTGAEYRRKATTYRLGYYFDKSPAPAAAVTPLLPDADRHGLSLGVGLSLAGNWHLDLYELGLFVNKRNGYAASPGETPDAYFRGDYKTFVNIAGIGLGYRW